MVAGVASGIFSAQKIFTAVSVAWSVEEMDSTVLLPVHKLSPIRVLNSIAQRRINNDHYGSYKAKGTKDEGGQKRKEPAT
jgi:hypothetical protein